ncbi:MAG: sigma 54-interacting transcriptional regulator [Desulfococcaceae bacterium]|jgi:PAS domain S-box-containing protein|nr:sigma 54-interacting transcriptional regulator [Desulfococcaceae bacterium]
MDKLLLSYLRLPQIFDFLSAGSIVIGKDRRLLSMNETARLLTACTEKLPSDRTCREILDASFCGGECLLDKAVEEGRDLLTADVSIAGPDDKKHFLTKIVSPLYDDAQAFAGCIVIVQDHSAFQELMTRVRYEGQRMKNILDHLESGVLTVDRSGYITFFNAAAENMSEFRRADVLGKSCASLFGAKIFDEHLPLGQTVKDGNPRSGRESSICTKGGQRIPVRANYMALKNENGRITGGIATLTDLSLVYQFNSEIKERYTFYDMVGRAPSMQKIFDILPVISESDATVLIEGRTGTGKDILTRVIHNASLRKNRPLVKVNCAALPENLLESEMFGYVKGAFTGADRDKTGRFQEADGGTIFLDEIGDLPLALQAKLLTVLEDKEFYPLGGRKTVKVDVRIISATNVGLEKQVQEKNFREDLFYRLNVMRIELPALRERKEDLPLLIRHILKRLCSKKNLPPKGISQEAMEILLNYDYPGNIRELENILEHAMIISQGKEIEHRHLPLSLRSPLMPEPEKPEEEGRDMGKTSHPPLSPEKEHLLSLLKEKGWNRGQTAEALGINRSTLWRKMKKYNILS